MRLYLKKELEELEKLIKLAGESGVADNSVEVRAGGARNFLSEAEEIAEEGGEAAHDNTAGDRVDEEADESTIEEIVIDSIIDKIAGGEAAHDKLPEARQFMIKLLEE